MKPRLHPLDRLFRSAARGRVPAVASEPPAGFEARVAAEWKAARSDGTYASLVHCLRQVLAGACLLIVIGALLNLSGFKNKAENEAAYADAAIRYQLLP